MIWPLNLKRMEAKMGPSRPYHSIPLDKIIVEEIMEDLSSREEGVSIILLKTKRNWGLRSVLILKIYLQLVNF